MASGDPLLIEDINMIIIAYFFILFPSEYMASKSEVTLFHLEDTAFSCGRSVFAATSTAGNLQATNFFTLLFMTRNNGIRGK